MLTPDQIHNSEPPRTTPGENGELLGEPHPAQQKVIQQAKRFNVVCCGRRWGKTVLGMDRLIHPALQGQAGCLVRTELPPAL